MQLLTRFTEYTTPEKALSTIFIIKVKVCIFIYRNPIFFPIFISFIAGGVVILIAYASTPRHEAIWIFHNGPGIIFFPSLIIGLASWMLVPRQVEKFFHRADEKYFDKSGITVDQYRNHIENEIKQDCSLRFSEVPMYGQETMFSYSEDAQKSAYLKFEKAALDQFHLEEIAYKRGSYVARYFGL